MASEERDRLIQNLKRLGLPHAANNIDEHLKQAGSLKLGHLAFIARVMEAEVLARQRTRADRRVRYAEFPEVCRIEDYDFKQQPSLVCGDLSQGFVRYHGSDCGHDVLVMPIRGRRAISRGRRHSPRAARGPGSCAATPR